MTAEITHSEDSLTDNQAVPPQLTPGTVIPMPRRSPESPLEPKEQQMLEAFRRFSMTTIDIDPQSMGSEQMPSLSFAAHDFLADVGKRRVESAKVGQSAVGAAAPGSPAHPADQLFVMPPEAVNQNIRDHYRHFGTRRRTTSEELRAIEEHTLHRAKKPLRAEVYRDEQVNEDDAPIKKVSSQAALYPEIIVGISLENALRTMGHETAADSVEVVLAAYGKRLGSIKAAAIAQRGVVRESIMGRLTIHEPDVSNIDPEMQAERTRRKKE
ncbi:MAG TPA: hypothetical protein VGE30_02695 [Candidatus Saccharimonadales bacterium]